MSHMRFALLFLVCILAATLSEAEGRTEVLKVGYGKACITPALGTPCGKGLDDDIREILDDTYARAVWIGRDGEGVLVAAADVVGICSADTNEFASRISSSLNIPSDRIIIHATHSHETPSTRWEPAKHLECYGLSDKYASPDYRKRLSDGLVDAARRAVRNASPCEMAYAEARVSRVASNRRVAADEPGKVVFRGSRPNQEMRDKPEGEIDPMLRVVLFRALDSGKLIGLCNYNCHPSAAGGDQVGCSTGDFAGVGLTIAEESLGNADLLHLTGTCGDINPGKYATGDTRAFEDRKQDVQQMGKRYGDAILDAVNSADNWRTPDSVAFARSVTKLSIRDDMLSESECRAHLDEEAEQYARAHADGKKRPGTFHPMLYRYHTHRIAKQSQIHTTAAALRVGDICFTFLPGEIFLRFGNALREATSGPLINSAYCMDYNVGYVVPPECYEEGGYESGATRLGPEAYGKLLGCAKDLLREVGREIR